MQGGKKLTKRGVCTSQKSHVWDKGNRVNEGADPGVKERKARGRYWLRGMHLESAFIVVTCGKSTPRSIQKKPGKNGRKRVCTD